MQGQQYIEMYISIYITLGNLVYSEKAKSINSQFQKQINLGSVSKGIYLVKVIAGETVMNKKIIVD